MAGLHRQLIYAGLRVGFYPTIRDIFISGENSANLFQRIIAGMTTGAFGILFASPCDVVKVRLQSEGKKILSEAKYNGSFDAYKKIYAQEGARAFYNGLTPNVVRSAIMNSAELASYDQLKTFIVLKFNLDADLKFLHFGCAIFASFMAVLFASPADVLKTRIMSVF